MHTGTTRTRRDWPWRLELDKVTPSLMQLGQRRLPQKYLRLLASRVGARIRPVHTPPFLAFGLPCLVGLLTWDIVIKRNEVDGQMAGLLTSDAPSAGHGRLGRAGRRDWLNDQRVVFGQQ